MDVARGAAGIHQVPLGDDDERTGRHAAFGRGAFDGYHLVVGATDVDGARRSTDP
jgi:hypothetical protein